MSKLSLLAAAGVGYVLGARAGRQRYEQIAGTARKVAGNPQGAAGRQCPGCRRHRRRRRSKDKVTSAASSAADKVRRDCDRQIGHAGDAVALPVSRLAA